MEKIKNELKKSKLKLLETINKKLDSDNLTSEDLKNISAALSNVISFSDYADKLYQGFNGFNSAGAQRIEETNIKNS